MATTEQLLLPQSYLAMGSGDLVQVQDFRVTLTDNSKQVHTLRRKGAGITQGVEESTVTFNSVLDEDGSERDYWRLVQKKIVKQIRAKAPGGKTLVINGKFSGVDLDGPLDDATKIACTFIGKMEDQQGSI